MRNQMLCSIAEASTTLGIGRTKLYQLLANGQLASLHIGTRRLVKVDSIKALLEGSNGGAA